MILFHFLWLAQETDQQNRFDLDLAVDGTDVVVVAVAVAEAVDLAKSWLELAPDQGARNNNGMLSHTFWEGGEIYFLQHIMLPHWIKCPSCPPDLNLLLASLQAHSCEGGNKGIKFFFQILPYYYAGL